MHTIRPTHLAAFLVGAALLLAAAPARAEMKIGVVDMQRALLEIEEGKAIRAKLKAEVEAKQKEIDKKKGDFDKARADAEKQASVMSEEAKKQKMAELQKQYEELQNYYAREQTEYAKRESDATRGILERMNVIVREIADAEGMQMVVQAVGVAYAAPSLDVTNELIRKYNARYKGGAAPAAPAGAKKGKDGK